PPFLTTLHSRSPPLFPYTTLFRSARDLARQRPHSRLELDRRDEDLADVLLAQVLDVERPVAGLGQQLVVVLAVQQPDVDVGIQLDRKSTRLNSSHQIISYAVFCLK